MADQSELLARTTEIVSAHLRKNTVSVDQVPALINDIHQTLAGLGVEEPELTPAVPIKRSVRKASIA
ncbi:MucR family transcriptional regulator, partial [Shewanella sp. C31]|nr:MucR family transcriptional regulator [Shewanella electrica]